MVSLNPFTLTLQVSKKDLKITQEVEESNKRSIKKIKFPVIPARDVTYVQQATRPGDGRPDDIVACIYLGYMPRTRRYVHVHVYRFDEASTATVFFNCMSAIVEMNSGRIREAEIELANRGEIDDLRLTSSDGLSEPRTTDSAVGSGSSAYSDDESRTFGSDDIDPDLQSLKDVQAFDNVTDELKFRLHAGDAPLLLPPKDYDTVRRNHGNLEDINKRRCLNLNIVGETALQRDRNGSYESGVDLTSPVSETAEVDESSPADKTQPLKMKSAEAQKSPSVIFPGQGKLTTSKEEKSPGQVHHKATSDKDTKNPPQALNKHGVPDTDLPKSGHLFNKVNKLPEATPSADNYVYPLKISSPPVSPQIQQREIIFDRHGYHNSSRRERSNPTHHPDEDGAELPVQHHKRGPLDDIYSLPVKTTFKSNDQAYDELPPDYQDDVDETPQLRGMNQRYGQPFTAGGLPEGSPRTGMNYRSSLRASGSDFLNVPPARYSDSQVLVRGPQHSGHTAVSSHPLQRIGSSKR